MMLPCSYVLIYHELQNVTIVKPLRNNSFKTREKRTLLIFLKQTKVFSVLVFIIRSAKKLTKYLREIYVLALFLQNVGWFVVTMIF